ncbi:hypothetical protein EZJ19_10915 [Parasulfuritortus cantonensis]|uniref:Uncharacterized protein n=1 Tax=Parasulfuritortus cantonensis TaxID=2528202 RepID=A0A4R1B769_9PROT|nr:hypothetical protein [Parasulfuritortus cantonensis]TCJ12747.1 hypothetical protein EZJ19_10915 [Parasulfuritortus cantonensis]
MAATARPRHLPLFQLHAGMILAQPIRCSNEGRGVLDLPAGQARVEAIFRDADLSEPGQCGLFAAIRRYRCRP